ncbi:hypothetical protein BJ138DRAFT_1159945 [Hygrophoropsis aurantiaca]|uniref:Uncharacterized protein n=1 Tax=Hygrophoropsis aurantiaca TaxID=72124 RepID=A0ACB8A396_9AGAM|nr:hypothetical protein BJ138DRAFT_1159945 [Hygrophoropsis aurantiaca]
MSPVNTDFSEGTMYIDIQSQIHGQQILATNAPPPPHMYRLFRRHRSAYYMHHNGHERTLALPIQFVAVWLRDPIAPPPSPSPSQLQPQLTANTTHVPTPPPAPRGTTSSGDSRRHTSERRWTTRGLRRGSACGGAWGLGNIRVKSNGAYITFIRPLHSSYFADIEIVEYHTRGGR